MSVDIGGIRRDKRTAAYQFLLSVLNNRRDERKADVNASNQEFINLVNLVNNATDYTNLQQMDQPVRDAVYDLKNKSAQYDVPSLDILANQLDDLMDTKANALSSFDIARDEAIALFEKTPIDIKNQSPADLNAAITGNGDVFRWSNYDDFEDWIELTKQADNFTVYDHLNDMAGRFSSKIQAFEMMGFTMDDFGVP